MPRHGRWLLGLIACSSCAERAGAKVVMGIAGGEEYQQVSTFCFTFPAKAPGEPTPSGHIRSQTIVSSSGHKLLVLKEADLRRGLRCDELVRRATLSEPLTERTKDWTVYDMTRDMEPSMGRQDIAAVIARCGQAVDAEYIIEFTNPGGDLGKHFACSDQGLLQTYLCFSALAAALTPAFASALRVLHRRQAHNDISAIFFAGAGFYGGRVWLFTAHLLVYSRNGMGLGMLLFVAQFLDFLCTTMVTLVLMALVHGVYVTRPCIPTGSEERRALLQVVGCFTAAHLVSTLACGFKVDGLLSPFGVAFGAASWPYLLARACTGLFCFNRGVSLAKEDGQPKKNYVMRFSLVAVAWLLFLPATMLATSVDSWHSSAFLLDVTNFGLFGLLLYEFWPSRFGALFSHTQPTERTHPYAEFGSSDT